MAAIRALLTVLFLLPAVAWAETPTCAEWAEYSPEHQVALLEDVLGQPVFMSLPDTLRECVRSISQDSRERTSELCKRQGAKLDVSARRAVTAAVQYCQAR